MMVRGLTSVRFPRVAFGITRTVPRPGLLRAQRHHRVDAGRAPGGHQARGQPRRQEEHGRGGEAPGVERPDAEEEVRDGPGHGRARQATDRDARQGEPKPFAQHETDHVAGRRAQGGAQAQLNASSRLLKSGWNLVLFPEGSRSPDGRIQEFKPGVGHLANETGTPVVPMHLRGAYQVMPKGQKVPLPGPVRVRIGKPMSPQPKEGSREFTARVEKAVRALAAEPRQPEIQGGWIERWRATKPRELEFRDQ